MGVTDSATTKERGVEAAGPRPGHAAATSPRPCHTGHGGAAVEDEGLQQHPMTLAFRSSAAEVEFAAEQASSRWRVLFMVAAFDCAMFLVRAAAKIASGEAVARSLSAQLANMAFLYSLTALLNLRTRRLGTRAAHQEEVLLCGLLGVAISLLLLSLRPSNACDYVYAALFLTCTSSVLKLRWFVGTTALAVPVLVACATNLRLRLPGMAAVGSLGGGACAVGTAAGATAGCLAAAAGTRSSVSLSGWVLEFVAVGPLSLEALVHILVAWAVGALMAFVSDSNRRQSFVNHKLALGAASKELEEVQARVLMERELAQAQQQAAARALVVAKEKAANEAKSEFMSLMCHEVRTPLNGCLASAEMLLDTELDEDQRELAKTIRVSGSILLSTVSNFLDFFKIEAGKQLDIVRSPLDLRDLVTDVHCIIEAMVGRERGVTLMPPNLDGAPATVLGDPSRICGILLNLYTNAAKYTKRGSIGLQVRVVGANYRPDPAIALHFYEASSATTSGATSRASRSLSASMPDSARDTSRCSTPTGVVPAGAGTAAAGAAGGKGKGKVNGGGGAPGAPAAAAGGGGTSSGGTSSQHPLYLHGGAADHDSAQSLQAASAAANASAATDAAALLTRQAAAASAGVPHAIMSSVTEVDGWCSVHSQADPHFVLRHVSRSQAGGGSGSRSGTGSSGSDDEGTASQRFLCFEVMDTGVGVSHKALESLFQDYVQGTDSEMRRPRSKGGTGLGLSICCKQVAVLGGAIGALSKPGCGSIFWFTTPLLLPPHDSSSTDSLEESEEEAVAAGGGLAPPAVSAAEGLAAAAATPAQAAGQAAIRRSLEVAVRASADAAAAIEVTSGGGAGAASGGGAAAAALPSGIPASGYGKRQGSSESSQARAGSGSRRHSMESNLSSMWPSHKSPRQHAGAAEVESDAEDPSYHPRHALSWEQPAQPPSFTVAEMLQQMPLQSGSSSGGAASPGADATPSGVGGGAAAARHSGSSSLPPRPSAGSAVAHMGQARHQPPAGSGSGSGAAAAAAAAASAASAAAQRQRAAATSLQGLRVLLAEDNLINQTVAKRVLTSLGCECRVASNGREAVMAVEEAAAAGAQFDVILMDMCMPVLGGVEATQEIRQLGCHVPIVAMTANASERDRVECIAAGMDGFLSKPVLKEQLTVAIREAIQVRRS